MLPRRSDQEALARHQDRQALSKRIAQDIPTAPLGFHQAVSYEDADRKVPETNQAAIALGNGAIRAASKALREAGFGAIQLKCQTVEPKGQTVGGALRVIHSANIRIAASMPWAESGTVGTKDFGVNVSFDDGQYHVASLQLGVDELPVRKASIERIAQIEEWRKQGRLPHAPKGSGDSPEYQEFHKNNKLKSFNAAGKEDPEGEYDLVGHPRDHVNDYRTKGDETVKDRQLAHSLRESAKDLNWLKKTTDRPEISESEDQAREESIKNYDPKNPNPLGKKKVTSQRRLIKPWDHETKEPGLIQCDCGKKVEIEGPGLDADCGCGRSYNSSGQLLADRAQWGEETGEIASDYDTGVSEANQHREPREGATLLADTQGKDRIKEEIKPNNKEGFSTQISGKKGGNYKRHWSQTSKKEAGCGTCKADGGEGNYVNSALQGAVNSFKRNAQTDQHLSSIDYQKAFGLAKACTDFQCFVDACAKQEAEGGINVRFQNVNQNLQKQMRDLFEEAKRQMGQSTARAALTTIRRAQTNPQAFDREDLARPDFSSEVIAKGLNYGNNFGFREEKSRDGYAIVSSRWSDKEALYKIDQQLVQRVQSWLQSYWDRAPKFNKNQISRYFNDPDKRAYQSIFFYSYLTKYLKEHEKPDRFEDDRAEGSICYVVFPSREQANGFGDELLVSYHFGSLRGALIKGDTGDPTWAIECTNCGKFEDIKALAAEHDGEFHEGKIPQEKHFTEDPKEIAKQNPFLYQKPKVKKAVRKAQQELQLFLEGAKRTAQTILTNPSDSSIVNADSDMEILRRNAADLQWEINKILGQVQAYQDGLAAKKAAELGLDQKSFIELQAKASSFQQELESKLKSLPQNFIRFSDGVLMAKKQNARLNDASWKDMIEAAKERGKGVMRRVVLILDRIALLFKKMTSSISITELSPDKATAKDLDKITKSNVANVGKIDKYQQDQKDIGPTAQRYFLDNAEGQIQQPGGRSGQSNDPFTFLQGALSELNQCTDDLASAQTILTQVDHLSDRQEGVERAYPLPGQHKAAGKLPGFSSVNSFNGSLGVRRHFARKN